MSEQSNPMGNVTASSNTAGTEGAAPAGTGGKEKISASTHINTLEDIKEISPKLHQAILQSIASNIVDEMKKQQEELKKKWREAFSGHG